MRKACGHVMTDDYCVLTAGVTTGCVERLCMVPRGAKFVEDSNLVVRL